MIIVYEVSRKYIMLIMHNNIYLPLTALLTYFVLPEKNVVKFLKYFRNISRNISWNISRRKISWNFTALVSSRVSLFRLSSYSNFYSTKFSVTKFTGWFAVHYIDWHISSMKCRPIPDPNPYPNPNPESFHRVEIRATRNSTRNSTRWFCSLTENSRGRW